ncbi:MAG: nitroreductase family protein [Candidatus Omnitrophota bacterium]|nr:nitroreductase family protein [Candidatus Omnitrophota bacterium]
METFESIVKRTSIRQYRDRPIEKPLLEKLVDAARRAPSARAVEPWEFVVIENKETLTRLGQTASSGVFIKDAVACIAVFCKETKYYLEDGCAATENILLAAADLGLGACWVAGDKKPYADEVSKLLNAPPGLKLVSLVSLGWPKEEDKREKVRSLQDVIHWERL